MEKVEEQMHQTKDLAETLLICKILAAIIPQNFLKRLKIFTDIMVRLPSTKQHFRIT